MTPQDPKPWAILCDISIPKILEVYDPYTDDSIWDLPKNDQGCLPRSLVEAALKASWLLDECWTYPPDGEADETWTLYQHAARIAYLIVNGWDTPIDVDFEHWRRERPVINDGNHRLMAAIYMGLPYITAHAIGDEKIIAKYLVRTLRAAS